MREAEDPPVRVVLAEDDPRYRQGLETLFSNTPGFTLAASFPSADAALLAAPASIREWEVFFMDVDLPGTSGIDAARRLKALRPELAVLMLTVFEAPETMLQAICAGADGYLLKRSSARTILDQARLAQQGAVPLTAPVAGTILDIVRRLSAGHSGARPTRVDLSERERDVLRLLVDGRSYKQVGDALGIHIETVRTHVRNLYKKLRVHSAAEAVARALRDQLV